MSDDPLTVRSLQPDDFEGFCALMTRFYEYAGNDLPPTGAIRRLFDQALSPEHNLEFSVALKGSELIGLVSVTIGESSYKVAPFAWCDDLYVDPQHRGAGVGTRLLQAVAELATQRGCSNILVATGQDDDEAQKFYGANGFIDMNCKLLSLPIDSSRT